MANYFKRAEEIAQRLNAIADSCEAEKREMTDAEKEEVASLDRERTMISLRMKSEVVRPETSRDKGVEFGEYVREALGANKVANIEVRSAITTSTSNFSTSFVPLTINDLIEPLEEGLIYHLVGIKINGGLAGAYVWPAINAVEASIANEAASLSDGTLTISNVTPTPKRIGISFLVSMQVINQSVNRLYDIIKQQVPISVARLINRCMFTPDTVNASFKGPFVYCLAQTAKTLAQLTTKALQTGCYKLTFAGQLPTYKELLAMRGAVMARGVINDGTAAYVMDEWTKAELESTPRDTGSGRMIVEDGHIGGVPVFCTNEINVGSGAAAGNYIGFGVWSNVALGQFGDQRLVIDTVSAAVNDCARITLNGDWSMSVLRQQAFCLGVPTI